MNDDERTAVSDDPEAIRHEIEATRARIAETAEALAYKTDVSARLKDTIDDRLDATKNAAIDASANAMSAAGVAATTVLNATQSAGIRGLLERALALPRTSPVGVAAALLALGFVLGLVAPGGGRRKRPRIDETRLPEVLDLNAAGYPATSLS